MSINKVILIGRLGQDPEMKGSPENKPRCTFSLATTEVWRGEDGQKNENTTWHNIVAFGKQAETIHQYVKKGQQIYIEGRIDNRQYEDNQGEKRYWSGVVVQRFTFLGGKGAQTDENASGSDDDDLPF